MKQRVSHDSLQVSNTKQRTKIFRDHFQRSRISFDFLLRVATPPEICFAGPLQISSAKSLNV